MADAFEPASFRDRTARVFLRDGLVYRALSEQALNQWQQLSRTRFFQRRQEDGSVVATEPLASREPAEGLSGGTWVAVLKHEPIPFVSYPYEWCFGMLRGAACLQLDLLLEALDEGMVLKDASAYNVQWRGARPVFIDIGSFEPLAPGEPWVGYRQFCQLFLYPLMLQAYRDLAPHAWLRGSLDGIPPGDCRRMMSARDVLRRGVLAHVVLQAKAETRYGGSGRDMRAELKRAGFSIDLIRANVRSLRALVESLSWQPDRSTWSEYTTEHGYTTEDQERKVRFVATVAGARRWPLVWDLGCNTGRFARVVAEHADYVVALDADQLAVERLYRALAAEGNRTILPLVGNLADPSPGLGWRGRERVPLADRGTPDLILCLALLHHLVISANIPLPDLIDWLAGLGADLVIEFVDRGDPMVQRLLLNKADQYQDYDRGVFESCLSASFRVVRTESLESGTRVLYHATRR
jgi:SAM-dependent methyltransferase